MIKQLIESAPSRIVWMSSWAEAGGSLDWDGSSQDPQIRTLVLYAAPNLIGLTTSCISTKCQHAWLEALRFYVNETCFVSPDLGLRKTKSSGVMVYGTSKLYDLMAAREMARRLQTTAPNVTCVACHPVRSHLQCQPYAR